MREIVFYKTRSGNSPVREFLDELPGKIAQKVTWVLSLIEELDSVPKQYLKKLIGTDDIWEVRVQSGNDVLRLLGFFDGGRFVVLTNGFIKKSQKVPLEEIRLAERRKQEYVTRKKKL
ncbi:MAG: type II toxin-antitoxin system RelE/ParE family toxin [Ignavibacteriae bacterium]|nr:type II toxin-antitoxin system RelE/ParE family toxin [Ignavibacteriota bacterium]